MTTYLSTPANLSEPPTPQPDAPLSQDERDVLEAIRAFGPLPYDQIGRRALLPPVDVAIAMNRVVQVLGVRYVTHCGYVYQPPIAQVYLSGPARDVFVSIATAGPLEGEALARHAGVSVDKLPEALAEVTRVPGVFRLPGLGYIWVAASEGGDH